MNACKWIRTTGTFFLTGILIFAGSEIFLRIARPLELQYYRDVKLVHRYHPSYIVGLAKNEDRYIKHFAGLWEGRFTTNSLGLRASPEPDQSMRSIACLGDSLVMGYGVSDEHTFCSLLGQKPINGKLYQAMNFGVDAYGSLGAARRLKEKLPQTGNTDIVLFFVSPNDFTMPQALREQGLEPDDVVDQRRMDNPAYLSFFKLQFEITRYSYSLQALKLAYEQLRIRLPANFRSAKEEFHTGLTSPVSYLTGSFYRFPGKPACKASEANITKAEKQCPEPVPETITCESSVPDAASLEPLPEITRNAYDEMIETSNRYGAQLVLVILPMQNEELFCAVNGMHHPLGNYAIRAESYMRSKGIPVINLISHAGRMCSSEEGTGILDHYLPNDGHLTVEGNLWAAESLRKELEKLNAF